MSFQDTNRLGRYGETYVFMGLKKVYADPRPVPNDIEHQLEWGDFVQPACRFIGHEHKRIEVKTERRSPRNNFFIERWSNRSTGRDGWMKTSKADQFYYLFWEEDIGFWFPNWQRSLWIIDYMCAEKNLIKQRTHEQRNDTWGFLVGRDEIEGPFAPVRFELDETIKKTAVQHVDREAA